MSDTKKVVVLGANSFSGQDFVDLLLDHEEFSVIGMSRSPERSAAFLRYRRRRDLARFRYVQADLNRDLPAIVEELDREQPQYLVNFAAQSEVAPSWEHPEHWFQTNTVALAQLVKHLSKRSYLQRFVQISSPEVYGNCTGAVREGTPANPSTPYAASKAAADMLLSVFYKQYGFPLLTVRATNVYGAGQQLFKIIPRTVIYLKSGRTIELHGGGRAVKSFIHIRDVSRGELDVMRRGRIGELYHLSPPRGVAVCDVVRMVCEQMGKSFTQATRVVGERPGQDAAYLVDSTRAQNEFGWEPTVDIQQGLCEVIAWVNEYWNALSAQPLEYRHTA